MECYDPFLREYDVEFVKLGVSYGGRCWLQNDEAVLVKVHDAGPLPSLKDGLDDQLVEFEITGRPTDFIDGRAFHIHPIVGVAVGTLVCLLDYQAGSKP